MADYPSQMKFFRLVGLLGHGFTDSNDVGDEPDLLGLTPVHITARPNIDAKGTIGPVYRVPLANPPEVIWQDPIFGTTDVNGNIVPADSNFVALNDANQVGMVIPWGGSAGIVPNGWTWTITIEIASTGNTFPPRVFVVYGSDGGTFDVATLVEVPANPGVEIAAWSQVVNQATLIRDQILAIGNGTGSGSVGGTGKDGLSAYQIAVKNGFAGTETQWIASLKGVAGNAGLSAYQLAVNNGFTGNQTAWLATLVGLKGDKGDTGVSDLDVRVQNADGTYSAVGTRVKLFWGQTPPAPSATTSPALFARKA